VEVVASLSQGRTAAAQCGLFTHISVPVIFEPPCMSIAGLTHYVIPQILMYHILSSSEKISISFWKLTVPKYILTTLLTICLH